jgi:hypothetical protein
VNAALREAGLDLLDTDTDAAAATVGLLRPNRSGRIGGLHVYRLQEAPA